MLNRMTVNSEDDSIEVIAADNLLDAATALGMVPAGGGVHGTGQYL